MPEIPEMRAHGERLTSEFAGATLEALQVLSFTALKTFDPPPDVAVGSELDEATSYSKYLKLRFADVTYVIHLMQGGRLRPDTKQSNKPRGGLARWRFADGRALLLTEPGTEHRAGVWVLKGNPDIQSPINEIAPEATSFDAAGLHSLFEQNNMRLHGFLRDQRVLSGLGRRLSNEVCHRARISPFATTGKLDMDAATAIHTAISEVVAEGLAYDRAQSEMSKSADRPSNVHGRDGLDCPVCGDEVRSVTYRRYTVSYCATCQTGGRLLADNTTSKFLK